ncbi:MAG: TackOD1 domain-containing metal-binding protein [Candidatus Hermodarchaeia archaeon]|jgi:hypothetical protein
MVLYGIWLIDANSGLLLSHITVPGFSFNPDLFSGFIAATHDFARETSGGMLETIALGNFKLLIRRGRVLMKVLAVGARDPEARYTQFFNNLEEHVDPLLADLHREPGGFKAVTIEFRRQLLKIISSELERFATRKAPSDLSELSILREEDTRSLIEALLQRNRAELVPELATTKIGYSYPLASSITSLDDEESMRLLERLGDYGLLLPEPTDTALACPKCNSIHLHPHILCPSCQTPAQPVDLYEHIACGHIAIKSNNNQEHHCESCGAQDDNGPEFRNFRGYQCHQCNASFKQPQMIFICHSCHAITEPEETAITVLKKYVLNPALIPELEFLLTRKKHRTKKSPKKQQIEKKTIEEAVLQEPSAPPVLTPRTESSEQPESEELPPAPAPVPMTIEATKSASTPPEPLEKIISGDEAQLAEELKKLENALKEGTITEAEYDRKFVRIRLQLRQLRTQASL